VAVKKEPEKWGKKTKKVEETENNNMCKFYKYKVKKFKIVYL
jgi:hypothetical protein